MAGSGLFSGILSGFIRVETKAVTAELLLKILYIAFTAFTPEGLGLTC